MICSSVSSPPEFMRACSCLREIECVAALPAHPHIVGQYRAWQQQGHFYIQMELCEGGTLAAQLRQARALTVAAIATLITAHSTCRFASRAIISNRCCGGLVMTACTCSHCTGAHLQGTPVCCCQSVLPAHKLNWKVSNVFV